MHWLTLGAALLAPAVACESSSDDAGSSSSGGSVSATGGSTSAAGQSGSTTGGRIATGGVPASQGGVIATGGTATGGSPASPTGGQTQTGGAPNSGGAPSTGGETANGGSPMGGAAAQGGTAGAASGGRASGGGGNGGSAGSPLMCPPTAATLKEAGACSGRLIGTAIATSHLNEAAYVTTLREHNYATAENEMKWDSLEPNKGAFNYANADQFVNFAEQNGMKIKGHTLVWHLQLPNWVTSMNDPDDVRAAMTNHIKTIIGHYKDRIKDWDVVNEAFENPNDWPDENTPTYRNSVFYRVLGKSFVDDAFKAAREADPTAKLIYNDFRSEGLQPKSNAVYEMVKSMVERGIPIDAVGLQTHLGTPNSKPPIADVIANMKRIADLGLEVMISEMDSHCCDGESPESQATRFHDIVAACLDQPACTAITFWGTTDKYSWLNTWNELDCGGRKPSGLLWDDNYQKKPVYTGVMNALLGK
jgi:endo-1,4-beta-xylanase